MTPLLNAEIGAVLDDPTMAEKVVLRAFDRAGLHVKTGDCGYGIIIFTTWTKTSAEWVRGFLVRNNDLLLPCDEERYYAVITSVEGGKRTQYIIPEHAVVLCYQVGRERLLNLLQGNTDD